MPRTLPTGAELELKRPGGFLPTVLLDILTQDGWSYFLSDIEGSYATGMTPSMAVRIAAGASAAAGNFMPDTDCFGGIASAAGAIVVDLSKVGVGVAPVVLYQNSRFEFGSFRYVIPGLTPG